MAARDRKRGEAGRSGSHANGYGAGDRKRGEAGRSGSHANGYGAGTIASWRLCTTMRPSQSTTVWSSSNQS